jgi:hypothetical protein
MFSPTDQKRLAAVNNFARLETLQAKGGAERDALPSVAFPARDAVGLQAEDKELGHF